MIVEDLRKEKTVKFSELKWGTLFWYKDDYWDLPFMKTHPMECASFNIPNVSDVQAKCKSDKTNAIDPYEGIHYYFEDDVDVIPLPNAKVVIQ